jgi:Secretion system C-terminal sorting domain
MKKAILLLTFLSPFVVNAQSACSNLDFEDTTFVNWNGATGINPGSLLTPNTSWVNGIVTTGPNALTADINNRMTLITTNYIDSIVLDPVTLQLDTQMTSLAPNGGSVSVRLGNSNMNYECERLTTTHTVTNSNPYFQYQFATVLEDPAHNYDAQPFLMINMYDQSMNIIPIGTDTIWSGDSLYPFTTTVNALNSSAVIKYRRWTPISVDLSAYIGQTITVEFVNSDCGYGGHFGYTYIDISCMGAPIVNVWPGDTDYDLNANNVDIIPLAISFGAIGPVRASASNTWIAQPSADWSQSFAFGMNYKHSDCNGDGLVDLNDTLAILLNYNQTHPFRIAPEDPSLLSTPTLYLVPINDTVPPASYFDVDVYIGSAAQPVSGFAGVAFDLNYDNLLVQPGTMFMDYTGSLLGTKNTDMLAINKDFWSQGSMGVGVCKTGGNEISGYGYLGRISMASAAVTTMSTLELGLSNVHAKSGVYTHIPLSVSGTHVVIDPTLPAGIDQTNPNSQFSFYPNPANETITVNTNADANTITITDALGREVVRVQTTGTQTVIDLSSIAAGTYFMNVISANGISTQQLMITK